MRHRLKLLGGLTFDRDGEALAGKSAQRRRLAVLALLGAAPAGALPRERILSLVWPDQPPESARRLLTEAIYVLRKELGEQTLLNRGDAIALNLELVSCDVAEFRGACSRGDWSAAAAEYRGPFLDGWFLPDSVEFERWAERERELCVAEYRRVLGSLADGCDAAGDFRAAAEWCRRLAELDAHDGASALRLADALAKAGEPGVALRSLLVYSDRLRKELEVEPGASVTARIRDLRLASRAARSSESGSATDTAKQPTTQVPRYMAIREQATEIGDTLQKSRPNVVWIATMAAIVVAVALGALLRNEGQMQSELATVRHRVAVLYFDDHSPAQNLGHLADGLTEEVINQLSGAAAFDVVGRNAVKQFRGRSVPLDSITVALGATIVVEGSVQQSDSSMRATVQLLDAKTGSRLGGAEVEQPMAELFALERGVGRQIAEALRRQVGADVSLRAIESGTASAAARGLLLRAQRELDLGVQLGDHAQQSDVPSALRALERADTLLTAAQRADPRWTLPTFMRGQVAIEIASLAQGEEHTAALVRAKQRASEAVARAPDAARALELDGTVSWMRLTAFTAARTDSMLLRHAESSLRAALRIDPALASAWATLSYVLWFKGEFAEADIAARRALKEDAYLAHARVIYERAFFTTLGRGDTRSAADWCERGRKAYPADLQLVQCELTLMSRQPEGGDTGRAWSLVRQLDSMESREKAALIGHTYSYIYRRVIAATVSAMAGDTTRGRRELQAAREAVRGNATLEGDLAYDEAHLLLVLGDTAAAVSRLRGLLEVRPSLSAYVRNDPVFAAVAEAIRPTASRSTP